MGPVQLRHSFASSPGCSAERCTRVSVLYFQVGRKRQLLVARPFLEVLVRGEARVGADGDVVTCGGVTAGIDLSLHLVERFVSSEAAESQRVRIEHEHRVPALVTTCP